MRVLIAAVACYLLEELRSTLPRSEAELGPFVAGLAWGLLIYLLLLVASSVCTARYLGVPL